MPYDKALMESFYKIIKRELINNTQFKDIDQARIEIFKYRNLLKYQADAFYAGLPIS
ncbi:integrase core domain-containing protein [Enterococcus mundtii]|uniref:integrase core domain-containing protein n=1 Tax=Enterococcus mundtii TaxID=53346 RepID=UPI003BAAAB64